MPLMAISHILANAIPTGMTNGQSRNGGSLKMELPTANGRFYRTDSIIRIVLAADMAPSQDTLNIGQECTTEFYGFGGG